MDVHRSSSDVQQVEPGTTGPQRRVPWGRARLLLGDQPNTRQQLERLLLQRAPVLHLPDQELRMQPWTQIKDSHIVV